MINEFYCINLVEANRYQHCVEQFQKIGIDVKFWFTTRRPIMNMIGNQLPSLKTLGYQRFAKNNPFIYGAIFSCVFEHYSIIKQAYERKLDNIVIFEDDIKFLVNKSEFKYCLEHIPENYSVCKFYYSLEEVKPFNINEQIFIKSNKIASTLAYAISRSGMEEYIDAFENKPILCADMMFFYIKNIYVNNVKICQLAGFKSTINFKLD